MDAQTDEFMDIINRQTKKLMDYMDRPKEKKTRKHKAEQPSDDAGKDEKSKPLGSKA